VLAIALLAIAMTGCDEDLGFADPPSAERFEVSDLRFVGVEAFNESRLKSEIRTKESAWLPWGRTYYFDRDEFEADLKRIETFYHNEGYPDAKVASVIELDRERAEASLTIMVTEGEIVLVADVLLEGFGVLPNDALQELRKKIPLSAGERLSVTDEARAVELASHTLQDHGYAYAQVSAAREEQTPRRVRVILNAQPGPIAYFGQIDIAGNARVEDEIIRRQLAYRPGDLFRRSLIAQSQRQIGALELFESVRVEAIDVQQRPAEVRTLIAVVEGDPRRLTFSLGYGTEEKLSVEAGWQHLNLLGGGRTLELHGKWSWLDRGVEGRFTQPHFFDPKLALTFQARNWYVDQRVFRTLSRGGRGAVTWHPSRSLSTTVSFINEFESSRIATDALRDPTLLHELVALGLDATTAVQDGALSALAIDVEHRTAADLVNPQDGHVLSLRVEQAGAWLPGTFDYYNLLGEARYFTTLGARVTLAERIRYGSIGPMDRESNVPFFKRYFLGGATSLRGWGRFEVSPLSGFGFPIGGNSVFEASSEVRFPLFGKLGAVLFLDSGNVWSKQWTVKLDDLRFDAGPGFRYETPFGLARLDLAYQLNEIEGLRIDGQPQQHRWRVHFSIGQAF